MTHTYNQKPCYSLYLYYYIMLTEKMDNRNPKSIMTFPDYCQLRLGYVPSGNIKQYSVFNK